MLTVKNSVILFLIILISGCVSSTLVTIDSNVDGAEVIIDGVPMGNTPIQAEFSNAVWEDPTILITKNGYFDSKQVFKKEVKSTNLVVGLILWWPSLLWCYGPSEYQYFDLKEKK